MSPSMFSKESRQRLEGHEYTRWAADLSETHLEALLMLLGEFGARSPAVLRLLAKRFDDEPSEYLEVSGREGPIGRARIALDAISHMVSRGERFDIEEVAQRFQRGRGYLVFDDLPEVFKIAADKAAPETQWTFVIRSAEGYVLGGKNAKGQMIGADINKEGATVRTSISEGAVPEVVNSALKKQVPKFNLYGVTAIGPDSKTVLQYQFSVSPPGGENQTILVSADGKQVTLAKCSRLGGKEATSAPSTLLFSGMFRRRLQGKYTNWAVDLSEAHLEALLMLLGEFGARSTAVLQLLDKPFDEEHSDFLEVNWREGPMSRARIALENISRMVLSGERFDIGEATRRIVQAQTRRYVQFDDLPDPVKTAVGKASSQTKWRLIIRSEMSKGYLLIGNDAKDRHIDASVTQEGNVTLKTQIPEGEVPELVSAALKEQMPKFELHSVSAMGPDCQTVSYYEFWVTPPGGENQRILISADGRHITPAQK